ncbi:MAG: hypothetical protein KKF16_05070 [Euryarchaeota archaeon]|nr:hypothetical protein [Euryarchaeota archaeon]
MIESKMFKKLDIFFENLLKEIKRRSYNDFVVLNKLINFLLVKSKRFFVKLRIIFNLIFKKTMRIINKKINKVNKQRKIRPVSEYLKNIGEYKKEIVEERGEF